MPVSTDAVRARAGGRRALGLALALGISVTACAAHGQSSPATPGARYLAIAEPANDKLEDAFDALAGRDRNDLAAARADLRSLMSTERAFDRDLNGLALTGAPATTSHALVAINEARAALTEQASAAETLPALHAFDARLDAANGRVEDQVRTLRKELGLPPPATS